MCLFVYFLMAFGHDLSCHHQHQHSSLHPHSFVYLVFHFRHTPRTREESQKAAIHSVTVLSLSLDSWLLSLNYKGKVYIVPYRRATCDAHTDNSGKKRVTTLPMYNSKT